MGPRLPPAQANSQATRQSQSILRGTSRTWWPGIGQQSSHRLSPPPGSTPHSGRHARPQKCARDWCRAPGRWSTEDRWL
eukprot:12180402-Heterocapsa_arctica.AAC.1